MKNSIEKAGCIGKLLLCLALIVGGGLILWSSMNTELYIHKLNRIQFHTGIPVGNPSIAFVVYTMCGLLYIASGVLIILRKKLGKVMGIAASLVFALIFDNPLTHIGEGSDMITSKIMMVLLHFVVISSIIGVSLKPCACCCKSSKCEPQSPLLEKSADTPNVEKEKKD